MVRRGFLGLDAEEARAATAEVSVLPVPLEATVSYGGGTARGPSAILEASAEVEIYDREFGCEPVLDYGVETLPPVELPPGQEAAMAAIERAVAAIVSRGRMPASLGGEHTITLGCVRGVLRASPGPLTVVQVDAHADLRDSYQGDPLSHACVSRRLAEEPEVEGILQLGLRSVDGEQVEFARRESHRVRQWFADDMRTSDWHSELAQRVAGRRVYLTLDVDGLDPAVVPATGTPEPGGLSWFDALDVMRIVARAAEIVAIDCVELAPVPGLHASDFTAAKLVYKAMSYARLLRRKDSAGRTA
jgi:agmatinase